MNEYCYKFTSDGSKQYMKYHQSSRRYIRIAAHKIPKDVHIPLCNWHDVFAIKYANEENNLKQKRIKTLETIKSIDGLLSTIRQRYDNMLKYELTRQQLFAHNEPTKDKSPSYPTAHVTREYIGRHDDVPSRNSNPNPSSNTRSSSNSKSTYDVPKYNSFYTNDDFFDGDVKPLDSELDAKIKYLTNYGIGSKKEWLNWSIKNHPDKNPNSNLPIGEINATVGELITAGIW